MYALPPAPALRAKNEDVMFTTPLHLGALGFETEGEMAT